jgi:dienelactone hydrolase
MRAILSESSKWLTHAISNLKLGPQVRKGIILGLLSITLFFCITATQAVTFGFGPFADYLFEVLSGMFFVIVLALGIYAVIQIIIVLLRIIGISGIALFASFLYLIYRFNIFSFPLHYFIAPILSFVLLGGTIGALLSKGFKNIHATKKIITFLFATVAVFAVIYFANWMFRDGSNEHLTQKQEFIKEIPPIQAENPTLEGSYNVAFITYGSGEDKRRPEFDKDAEIKTQTVDASIFASVGGRNEKFRKKFWGFDFKSTPLNARVWYPEGDGPFPLILMVHGNHLMTDFSDPGYEYLGRLMASRGFIMVSIDENFFNSLHFGPIIGENDARAWLLLKHLELWEDWNSTGQNLFFHKVDLDNIALLGHSRGGDAVYIAAAFNKLKQWPDDANITFDFDFNIKSVICFGPVDGQYKPSGKSTPLENVNYLVLQGGHDAQAYFFQGKRQFERLKFTDDNYWFKSSVYIYRANHNNFNTNWGDYDFGLPFSLWLNQKPNLKGEEQRQIAATCVSAFLEATLHDKKEYILLFKNLHCAAHWLPEDIYITRFEDSNFRPLCTFEEDIDLTTGSVNGITTEGKELLVWNENYINLRHPWEGSYNTGLALGWRKYNTKDEIEVIPTYTVTLPDSLALQWQLDIDNNLMFSVAPTQYEPPPLGLEVQQNPPEDTILETNKIAPFDFSIELTMHDSTRTSIKLSLSDFAFVPPVLKSKYTKFKDESIEYYSDTEITYQTFAIPLSAFANRDKNFDPSMIKSIKFVFDKAESGIVIIDQIGFS